MLAITPEIVEQIAGELEVGYRVFVHKTTGALRTFFGPEKYEDLEKEFADEFKVFLKGTSKNPKRMAQANIVRPAKARLKEVTQR